ncbi:hypothetical protein WG66_011857 [Moniliophthora roreri]|nr:hypothetical protein WG66_011857 [Moniliophthora roreri]
MEAQNRFAPLGGRCLVPSSSHHSPRAWNLSAPILAAFISAGFSVPYPTPALNTNELRHILLCDKYKHEFTTRLQHPPVAPEALRQNNFPSPVELAQTTAALEEEEARSRAEMIRRRVGEAAESRGELAKGKRCPEKADCRVPNLICSRSSNPCASPRIGYGNTGIITFHWIQGKNGVCSSLHPIPSFRSSETGVTSLTSEFRSA